MKLFFIISIFNLSMASINNASMNNTSYPMRFLHVSTKTTKLNKKKYRKPTFDLRGGFNYSFLLDGSLFLSKAHADGTSDWLRYREHMNKCPKQIQYRLDKMERIKSYNEEEKKLFSTDPDDPWLKSTNWYYWDVDFSKHKIYIVDNPRDFMNLIIDYGHFTFCIEYRGQWQRLNKSQNKYSRIKYCEKEDEFKLSNLSAHTAINKFYRELDGKYDWLINTPNVQKLVVSRTERNMPLVKVFKHKVVQPKNGITIEFLADLIRSKNYYDKIIGDIDELQKSMHIGLHTFNFYKMNKDGYKGIYFTDNLIKVNKIPCPKEFDENAKCDCCNGIGPKEDDIPEVTRVPKIFDQFGLKMTQELKKEIKDLIIEMPQWLGSEQLMVWDWIFD